MSSASAPQHTKKPEKFHGGIVRVIDHKGGDYGGEGLAQFKDYSLLDNAGD